jgi:hypothetical protein
VPAPVVLAHIAERRANAALRCNGVAARRENFCDTGGVESSFRQTKCCAQSGATGADDNDVVTVIDEFVIAHAPNPILRIA